MLELKSTSFPQVQLTVQQPTSIPPPRCQRDSNFCSRSTIPHREFGALRTFLWVFLAATVSHPIIEADLLPHFPLLVDLANNNLLDTKTGLFVQGRPSSFFLFLFTIRCVVPNPYELFLDEYPSLTTATDWTKPVTYTTDHHISSQASSREAEDCPVGIRAYAEDLYCSSFFQLLVISVTHGP